MVGMHALHSSAESHAHPTEKPPKKPLLTLQTDQRDNFDKLLNTSARERAAVRTGVAEGHWRVLEPNKLRAAAFAARAAPGLRNFAEVQIGDTLDYESASFLARGADVRRAVGMVEVNLGG